MHIYTCRLVNMGVQKLQWLAEWADTQQWAKLLHARSGQVEAGSLTKIELEVSFPESLVGKLSAAVLTVSFFAQPLRSGRPFSFQCLLSVLSFVCERLSVALLTALMHIIQ